MVDVTRRTSPKPASIVTCAPRLACVTVSIAFRSLLARIRASRGTSSARAAAVPSSDNGQSAAGASRVATGIAWRMRKIVGTGPTIRVQCSAVRGAADAADDVVRTTATFA